MPVVVSGYSYDFDTRIVTAPTLTVDLQELVNTTREAEADLAFASHNPGIMKADGKQPLTDVVSVGITFSFINGWRVAFPAQGSPTIGQVIGGNLVAFLDDGTSSPPQTQFPVAPTANVSGFVAQSSSATLTEQRLASATKYLIESQRESHSAFGEAFYWDPFTGDDTNDGILPTSGRLTFQSIHDNLIADGGHDVVFLVAPTAGAGGPQAVDQRINITKDYCYLRGSGRHIIIRPSDDADHTIRITGKGCEVDSLSVQTAATGGPVNAIHVNGGGSNAKLTNLWIEQATGNGIYIDGGQHHFIGDDDDGNVISNCGGSGILLHDCLTTSAVLNFIYSCADYGFKQTATGPGVSQLTVLRSNTLRDNAPNDIFIGTNVEKTTLWEDNRIVGVTGIIDNGTDTINEIKDRSWMLGSDHSDALSRILGMIHENTVIDNQGWGESGHGSPGPNDLTTARIRTYDSKANALTATTTGLLDTYSVRGEYSEPGRLSLYRVVRDT